jgi:hypothetical protein
LSVSGSPVTSSGTIGISLAAGYSIPTTTKQTNWDTAYGWGNHASAGYLTSFTESDPTVPSHVKSITTTNVSNWNTAYGWGDHASAGYQPSASALTTSSSFGGDVSGTYNAIVIADDSHNHIISNVDGLQTALDAKEPTQTAASQAEMEAGTQAALRSMSPLRIAQAIAALTPTATISKSATGYWIDASGLIVQWGNNAGFSSTVRTVTFPIAFPTFCAAIAGAPRDVSSSSTRTEIITAKSNTSFSYKSEANHDGYYWIALGY